MLSLDHKGSDVNEDLNLKAKAKAWQYKAEAKAKDSKNVQGQGQSLHIKAKAKAIDLTKDMTEDMIYTFTKLNFEVTRFIRIVKHTTFLMCTYYYNN